jgi:hypothetical protein
VIRYNLSDALRTGEEIAVALRKGTVPFSSNENWGSLPVDSPVLYWSRHGNGLGGIEFNNPIGIAGERELIPTPGRKSCSPNSLGWFLEPSTMSARHLTINILLISLVSSGWNQASSQDAEQPSSTIGVESSKRADANVLPATSPIQGTDALSCESRGTPSCTEECIKPLCCKLCPTVYAEAEALFMKRDSGHPSRAVLIDANTQETLVSSSDLDFNFDSGLRARYGFDLTNCLMVELGYFGIFDSRSRVDYAGPNPGVDVTLPGPLGIASNVFHDGVRTRTDYQSQIQGAELNFPCCCCWESPCCDKVGSREWFVGFRYLSLRENFRIYGEKTVNQLAETAFYDLDSENDLFGAHLGLRIRRCRGRFSWEAMGKAGIFGNHAGQQQVFIDYPNFLLRPPVSGNGGNVAFVGDLNLTGIYQLNDTWGLRAGYNMMWIEGVALAPDQLDFSLTSTSGAGIHTSGGVFLHGFSVGLEARW